MKASSQIQTAFVRVFCPPFSPMELCRGGGGALWKARMVDLTIFGMGFRNQDGGFDHIW